ncbi:16002_t:CDS:2 [Dentiscutata heterogama]|uniref:16002_t:CDS:1 n=1 Tax=Dentiscutata heterogama TaxID=1316150 RepID=A0ACA9KLM4_9GLOM|nr:16002_t:CDS:2 [Dentiscutata heterogama]
MIGVVDRLYSEIYNLYNKGIKSIPEIIKGFLDRNFKSPQDIFKWLLFYNKDKSDYICLLGLFYHFNIGTDGTKGNEFELFQNAAASKNSFAEYFVGKCFEEGWNTKKKSSKAVACFKKSKDECLAARYSLSAYYYRKQKFYLAITELEKAVEKGNVKAAHLLGLCFQKGRGTNINVSKGFELFMRAAEEGLPEAQCELGRCYEFGNGTARDLSKALEWFKKSTSNGFDCSADLGRNPKINSTLITIEDSREIISRIDPSLNNIDAFIIPDKLKLLLKGKVDGFGKDILFRKIQKIERTILILQIKDSPEVIGGYNPLKWKKLGSFSSTDSCYSETRDSFIFSLKRGNLENAIFSKIAFSKRAIYHEKGLGPSFSLDLFMASGKKGKTWGCYKSDYECKIRDLDGSLENLISGKELNLPDLPNVVENKIDYLRPPNVHRNLVISDSSRSNNDIEDIFIYRA